MKDLLEHVHGPEGAYRCDRCYLRELVRAGDRAAISARVRAQAEEERRQERAETWRDLSVVIVLGALLVVLSVFA